jgi:NADH:ubiquinone oxidoreductase subunit 6 (subunit J)
MVISAFYISFGKNIISSTLNMLILLLSASGIYVMLNSELFALINILLFSGIIVVLLIFFPNIGDISSGDEMPMPKSHYLSILVIGILSSLLTSLVSSTRWPVIDINYEFNTFMLIFIKYLPVIILMAVLGSVMISSLSVLLNRNNPTNK